MDLYKLNAKSAASFLYKKKKKKKKMLTQSLSAQFYEVLSFDSDSSESFLHQSVILRKQLQLEEGPMTPEQSQLLLIPKLWHFHF